MTRRLPLAAGLACLALGAAPALADKIKNPTAVFSGLDKITGRIISFEVSVDETVQFGALQLTPKMCYTRPPTENQNTTGFVEVDEVTLDNKYRRIFNGWMFASSPGLHGIEHAIYDVWLTDCKGGTEVIAETKEVDDTPATARGERGRRQARPAAQPGDVASDPSGRLDIAPPRGVPVQPAQQPTRRFYPTNQPAQPSGGNFFQNIFGR
jgi:hypothetical protein